jgi:type VI secretion system protein ImpC
LAEKEVAKSGAQGETLAVDEFSALLKKAMPAAGAKQSRIEDWVRTLAAQALSDVNLVGGDALSTLDAMRSAIDAKLTEQINKVIHHPDYQKMESAWRGLHYMVSNTETSADLKIQVLNVSKDELRGMMRRFKGASWDRSPLFKKIYESEFGQLGGQPFGTLVCDYAFDHSGPDIDLLAGLARIGAAAHCPVIAAADPSVLGMESWRELSRPADLAKKFDTIEYAAWRSLRQSEDSRYLVLTLPRFLGRRPYGAKTEPVEAFAFEEETGSGDHDSYLWLNASYALAVRVTAAHKEFGWCTRIRGVESGGTVENLPTATFPTDEGGLAAKCPTEIAISDRREAELSKAGFMALVHRKNTDQATFIGGQTLQQPKVYQDKNATANANLSARLPYIFASTRFAHYLKCMVRDRIGGTPTANQLTAELKSWAMQYVDPQPEVSTDVQKAKQPLKDVDIEVVPDPENPGYFVGKFSFVPHYQLEGMDVSLSMVSRLPKGQG